MNRTSLAILLPTFLMAAGIAACPDPARAPETETARAPQAQGPALPGDPDDVVATIGDEKITLREVDESLQGELKQAEREYRQTIAEMREQAVERRILETLLDAEAKKKGYADGKELVQKEIQEATTEPSEEEMKAFYEQAKAQMGGRSYEEVKPQLQGFLAQQKKQEAFIALAQRLREEANVSVDLPQERAEVEAIGPARGPENAPVTIVAFSDFECPYCSRAVPTLDQIEEAYGDQVRIVFRDFPLPIHPAAPKAAEAGKCAAEQGKFWPLHDKMFENQKALQPEQLKAYAAEIEGLDAKAFGECLDSGRMAAEVEKDLEAGKALGVSGTPAFFVNGVMISGAQPFPAFKQIIDRELGAKGVTPAAQDEAGKSEETETGKEG